MSHNGRKKYDNRVLSIVPKTYLLKGMRPTHFLSLYFNMFQFADVMSIT